MTKKLVWRLEKRPTPDELTTLVEAGILKKEEAHEILFREEEQNERDVKSLESEIQFLRELVEKLSSRSRIVETIKEIHVPYRQYPWYGPYWHWCSSGSSLGYANYTSGVGSSTIGSATIGANTFTSSNTSLNNLLNVSNSTLASQSNLSLASQPGASPKSSFKDIKTF